MDIPLDADDEDQFGLRRDIGLAIVLGDTGKADLLPLGIAVLLHVLLGTLEDDATLLLVGLRTWSAAARNQICSSERRKSSTAIAQTRKKV